LAVWSESVNFFPHFLILVPPLFNDVCPENYLNFGFFPVLRIRIRDPGLLGTFLTPGSGIRDGRKSASGSGIRDEQPGSYFLELGNHFFAFLGVKIIKFFDEDPGSGIRDGDSSDPGSGMEKSRIRDPG
jgi:hypothetical protein